MVLLDLNTTNNNTCYLIKRITPNESLYLVIVEI